MRRNTTRTRLTSLAAALAAALPALAGANDERPTMDPARLRKAIDAAARYLANGCNANGQFVYRVNPNSKVRVLPKYNMLRHAGVVYALSLYHQRHPDPRCRDAAERGAGFLKRVAIKPVPRQDDMLAVWTLGDIVGKPGPAEAKLGGAGLALVALLSFEKVKPGTTPLDYLRRLGRFVLHMQKDDGSFYSKHIPATGGRSDRWTSLYYPGEAALGLMMLYEADPAAQWLDGAAKAIGYLARLRRGQTEVEADHWALLATARLLPACERRKPPVPREEVVRHAVQICEGILAKAEKHPRDDPLHGCLTADGRTTPTATRLEGLLAALAFLPADHDDLRERIAPKVADGLRFLLRAQIQSGDYAGGVPRALRTLPADHPRYSRQFNDRATEIRMDYVQHVLCAMLEYEQRSRRPAEDRGKR